jgi:hypothetical protein
MLKLQERHTPWQWRRMMLALLLLALFSGCRNTTDKTAAALLGRWQRISPAGPGDPNELSIEYIEFRPEGVLLTLIRDGASDTFWLNNSAAYSLTTSSQMEVVGTCWQGWERYTCTRAYDIALAGDNLKITGDQQAEYQRVGRLSATLPPTLAPPFPSPTPMTHN